VIAWRTVMGLINWIFDFYQQYRIDELRTETARARADAVQVRGGGGGLDVARLEQTLGELALASRPCSGPSSTRGSARPRSCTRN